MTTVALVVPAHRAGPILDRSLASMSRLGPAPDRFVVVVDGGDPATLDRAESAGAEVVSIPRSGPAVARNRGVEESASDVVLFVDSDIVVEPDLVARIRRVFDEQPGVDAVFGSYDAEPDDLHTVSRFRNLLHHWTHQNARPDASTFWAGCGAIRRGAFDAVGGFDASYGDATIEDIELGTRLVESGSRIVVEPAIQVKHLKRWTLSSMVTTDVAKRGVPWLRLMLRRRSMPDDLNTTTVARVRVVLATLAATTALGTGLGLVPRSRGAAATVTMLSTLSWTDRAFLRFLDREGGGGFALRSAPLLWLHHLSAAVAVVWVALTHRRR